jgi:hypothetical protein
MPMNSVHQIKRAVGATIVLLTICIMAAIDCYVYAIKQSPNLPRFYERLGIYTHKLTTQEWSQRIHYQWTEEDLQSVFGKPLQEINERPNISKIWKYHLPIRSKETGVVTDQDAYIYFEISGPGRVYIPRYMDSEMPDLRLFH